MKYPNPCTRCGLCCLSIPCPISINAGHSHPCPMLKFKGDFAICLMAKSIPLGDGCCIKARAYKNGIEFDFAALTPELKIMAVRQIREKGGIK